MNDFQKESCKKFLDTLIKEPMTVPLRQPVDPVRDQCPNYPEIIKNPMDLSTMKKKLNQNKYENADEFVSDIQLICDNAAAFNGQQSMLAMVGEDIMTMTKKWRKELCSSASEAWYHNILRSTEKLRQHQNDAPPSITFGPLLDLPTDYDISTESEENVKAIKELVAPFEVEKLKNVWAFVSKENKEKILDIIVKKEADE